MAKSRSPFEQMKVKNRDPRDNMFKNPLAGLETDTSPTKNISTSLEGTAGVVPSNAINQFQKQTTPWSGAVGDTPGQQQ